MKYKKITKVNPELQEAVRELKQLVRKHYPGATFSVAPDYEDRDHVNLIAKVGVDINDVFDLVLPTVFKFQDKGVPIHVIPV